MINPLVLLVFGVLVTVGYNAPLLVVGFLMFVVYVVVYNSSSSVDSYGKVYIHLAGGVAILGLALGVLMSSPWN